jgi:hypothetical protein
MDSQIRDGQPVHYRLYGAVSLRLPGFPPELSGRPHGPSGPMPKVVWRRGPPKNSTGPAAWARLWTVTNRIPPGSIGRAAPDSRLIDLEESSLV